MDFDILEQLSPEEMTELYFDVLEGYEEELALYMRCRNGITGSRYCSFCAGGCWYNDGSFGPMERDVCGSYFAAYVCNEHRS